MSENNSGRRGANGSPPPTKDFFESLGYRRDGQYLIGDIDNSLRKIRVVVLMRGETIKIELEQNSDKDSIILYSGPVDGVDQRRIALLTGILSDW